MAKTAKPQKRPNHVPAQRRDVPATTGLVFDVRDELKADIHGIQARMDARFAAMDAKFTAKFADVDSRFAEMDGKFTGLFHKLTAQVQETNSMMHRMLALHEQQHAENRIMLEALAGHRDRTDRLEDRVTHLERDFRSLTKR